MLILAISTDNAVQPTLQKYTYWHNTYWIWGSQSSTNEDLSLLMWNCIVGQVIPNISKELTAFILKGHEVQENPGAA